MSYLCEVSQSVYVVGGDFVCMELLMMQIDAAQKRPVIIVLMLYES